MQSSVTQLARELCLHWQLGLPQQTAGSITAPVPSWLEAGVIEAWDESEWQHVPPKAQVDEHNNKIIANTRENNGPQRNSLLSGINSTTCYRRLPEVCRRIVVFWQRTIAFSFISLSYRFKSSLQIVSLLQHAPIRARNEPVGTARCPRARE